jgi:hypothetical protein
VPLTTAQLATLKADILADGALNATPNTPDGNDAIAAVYNAAASPDFWVYRTGVLKAEYVGATSTDADGVTPRNFIWTGNGFITRSAGEQAAWAEIFNSSHQANPSLTNVRQAFVDVFSGTGNAASNRTHLANVSRRKATRVEKILAAGTGTAASPATMTHEGPVTYVDVTNARNLP